MHSRSFHSRMTLLALAAILLLALLPTFGRLAQAGQGVTTEAWTQLCTLSGMKLVKLPPVAMHAAGHAAAPMPSPDHGGMGMDCDYCPLLSMLTLAVAALVLALVGFAPSTPASPRAVPLRARLHPFGLGSRGPPAFSEIAL